MGFVHRDGSGVDIPVADIDDGVLDCLRVLVEQSTETHGGHFTAIAEFYCALEDFLSHLDLIKDLRVNFAYYSFENHKLT